MKIYAKDNNITRFMSALSAELRSQGGIHRMSAASGITANQVIARESADEREVANNASLLNSLKAAVKTTLVRVAQESAEDGETIEGTAAAGVEEGRDAMFNDAQLKAAAITAAALENPSDYAKEALTLNINNAADSDPLASASASAATISSSNLAQEAYDATELTNFGAYSMVYNVFAARQSPLQELFYRTICLTPDQNGVQIFTRVQVYYENARHHNSGKVDFKPIPLYQAVNDPSILVNNITRIYPVYDADPEVAEQFYTGVAPYPVTLEGRTFQTAPLKVGVEQGMIGLSQASVAGFTGEMTSEDQIAYGARIGEIWVEVKSATGTSILHFNLKTLGRTAFLPAPEGLDMDTILNFLNTQFSLSGKTLDVDGNPAAALATLRQPQYENHVAQFTLNIMGNMNLESSLVKINKASGTVNKNVLRVNADNVAVNEVDGAVTTAIRNSIESIELVAWYPDMNRTNYNLRQRGPLTGSREYHERFLVRLNSPIAAVAPANGEIKTTNDLTAPITAIRIRNDNDAISHLFGTHEMLMGRVSSFDNSLPRPDIKAIGKYVMNPFADHIEIDLTDLITTSRTKYVAEDMRYGVGNVFREALFRGIRKSLYESSLRIQTGQDGAKPTVAVGTNPVLAKHLGVKDSLSWLGDNFPYDVVIESHEDRRLGGLDDNVHEMFATLIIPNADWSPHNYGYFLYVPELVSAITINRQETGYNREVIVHSRCEHVVLSPWLLRFTFTGVSEVFTTRLPYAMTF